MLQPLAIVILSVLAAVLYGVVHDQVTARICIEYFTIGHPPIFTHPISSPTVVGLAWGVIATWWMGVLLGNPLAAAAQVGGRPKRSAGSLVRPIGVLLVCMASAAMVAGALGYLAASQGMVVLLEPLAGRVPADRHAAYLTDLWAHSASYVSGTLGGIWLIVRTWRSRAT